MIYLMGGRGSSSGGGGGAAADIWGTGGSVPGYADSDLDMNLAGLTPMQGNKVDGEKTLASVEARTNGLDHEQLYVIDDQGFVVAATDGDSGSVPITARTAKNIKGNVMTHNHPRDDSNVNGGTFSYADINCLSLGMSEMRAVASEGTYSLKAGNHADGRGFANYMVKNKNVINKGMAGASAKVKASKYKSESEFHAAKFNAEMEWLSGWYSDNAGKFGYTYTFTPKK